eukprot:TRINITY_DN4888_c0_g1_i2.p1 TRINITY_DN4888_c0_g1~~TRINITY_DN4888_c0_g1_i2.p1  ORF type:complete len:651 (-),score=142.31 TRINITY_DN4888_c0_g1_i2:99-2051(-)
MPTVHKGNLIIEDVPEFSEHITSKILQYQNTRGSNLLGFVPQSFLGGGILISTRFAETSQVHHVSFPLAYRRQLTFFPDTIAWARAVPNPKILNGFLYLKDVGGSEYHQGYTFDIETGNYKLITDGKSKNSSILLNHQGSRFAITSTKKNGRDQQVYISKEGDFSNQELLIDRVGLWFSLNFSSDDENLLVMNYVSINESYLYIVNVNTKELTPVLNSDQKSEGEKISYGTAVFNPIPGQKGIFFTSDESREFQTLQHLDLKTGAITTISHNIPWDVRSLEPVYNKHLPQKDEVDVLCFTVNEGGIFNLYRLYYKGGSFHHSKVEGIPQGIVSSLEFNEYDHTSRTLGFTVNSATFPGDVFTIDLDTKKITRFTQSEVGGLPLSIFHSPSLISFKSFDGLEVPAFFYKTTNKLNANKDGKLPVVIHLHGGPESQVLSSWNPLYQFLLNELGVCVLDPNVRGSSGYGKNYLLLDNWYKREDSVKDVGALIDWIKHQPELDSERVGVFGGSYGGYLVFASMIHFGDRLKCAVEMVGISNFVTFLTNTSEYRRDLRREEYGDERDPKMREFLERISPTTNAHLIKKPMLISHGSNDPRVPLSEADQIATKIRDNGVDVWKIVATDEGHGFIKQVNRDFYTNALVTFLEKYLLH